MAGRVQTAGERAGGDGTGKDRQRRNGTGGAWISVPASGNGFSKYSGKTDVIGRNRRLFAVLAHRRLLGTSMSPNCCLQNGILRKSHFPARSSGNPCTACPVPPASTLFLASCTFPATPQSFKTEWISTSGCNSPLATSPPQCYTIQV